MPKDATTIDDEPIIRVRGLVNRFGEQVVHDGVDLDVRAGEILGVVGGSGTGKSVLMRSILGLRTPDAGEIEVLGVDARSEAPDDRLHIERNTGVLFQDGALFSSLTVQQNVQFPMRENLKISQTLLDELATAKLEMVGLSADDGNKFPSELSGGMTKRAALARALALDPEIVFLDEPTSGLDPISASDFDALISTLQQTLGLTVFMVTHDLDSLNTVCDRVAALSGGKIVEVGPIEQLVSSQHPWVRSYFHNARARTRAPASH